MRAIGAPTGSVVPSGAMIWRTPLDLGRVRHSGLVGLDLDSSSPACTCSPSLLSQVRIVPCSIESDSFGIVSSFIAGGLQEVDRGADDGVGVDTEVTVKILDVAGLPEVADAQAGDRGAADRRQETQRVRMAVEHGNDRRGSVGGEQLVEDRVIAARQPLSRLQRPKQRDRVMSGTPRRMSMSALASDSRPPAPRASPRRRRRASSPAARRPRADVAAGQDLPAAGLTLRGSSGPPRAPDRSVGSSSGSRTTSRPSPEPGQGEQQCPLEVLSKRWLPGDAAGLLKPDRRRDDRLVGTALGCERDPGRGADENRLAARIQAERPRLERPADERVIQSANRQQRLAVARPGRSQLPEQAHEVALGDSQLDVLSVLRLAPAHERVGVVREPVDPVPRCQIPTWLIHPPRFVDDATSGLTVTTRAATSGALCERSTKNRPNSCWVEARPACARASSLGGDGAARQLDWLPRQSRRRLATQSASAEPSGKRAHGSDRSEALASASSAICAADSSAEWFAG